MDKSLKYNYLKFSSLVDTFFWDYYTLSKRNVISSIHPIVSLGELINQRKKFITINDSSIYKRCRVQIQGKGVIIRDEVLGKEIKTKKQQLCKEDDFLVAEIDAKVGGVGIVPKELQNAIVSGHYFLFEIDKTKLLPSFLGLMVKQGEFLKQIKSTGSTNYAAIRPYHVLEYKVPLPTLTEQQKIVDAYQAKIQQAKTLQAQANNLEEEIEKYLFDELGFSLNSKKKRDSFICEISFENIERWSVDHIKQTIDSNFILKGKYEPVRLKEIIEGYQYGLSEKASKENIGIPMLRMNNIYNSELKMDSLKYIPKTEQVNRFVLNKGDLLFNRTNSKELVGKTAIFDREEEYTFASYLIRVVVNSKVADVHFINYVFNSPILQFQKDLVSRQITGQANINAQEMREFLFPLPPLKKQKEIANSIVNIKSRIMIYIQESEVLIKSAEIEFEKQIFN